MFTVKHQETNKQQSNKKPLDRVSNPVKLYDLEIVSITLNFVIR